MKASVQTIRAEAPTEKSMASIFAELIKVRLTTLVVVTAAVGFYLGYQGPVSFLAMCHVLFGTGLLAAGAAALNQYLERDFDARMPRTESRPLPSGKLSPDTALILGGCMAGIGMIYLAVMVNATTSLLGAVTIAAYLFVYTPLKRITSLNTVIGAIPGALPPLMGWTAARGQIDIAGWSLFAILFFWQLPHFMAIAWMYREEYSKAGFRMLPSVDPDGYRTGRQAVSHTLGLLPISLCPVLFGISGVVYFAGALVLGVIFFVLAVRFARNLSQARARQLFYFSIIYLPLVLGLMVLDKAS